MLTFRLLDYDVIGSTNDEALRLYENGAHEGTVVRALRQTKGRGRRGRSWISPPGNLYFSIILKPNCTLMEASQLSFVMAVAIGEAISPLLKSPQLLSYKWPNDLLLDKQKVAGILIQTETTSDSRVEVCIVGIGVNIHAVPNDLAYPVTHLSRYSAENLELDHLLTILLSKLQTQYTKWQQEGFEPIRQLWLSRAHGLQQEMNVTTGETSFQGTFMGVSSIGALLLKQSDGSLREFASIDDCGMQRIQESIWNKPL